MMTIYETIQSQAPRVSNRPLTMIVIAWPNAEDYQAVDPVTEAREPIDSHAEDEPTWEDAAWV